MPVLMLSEGQLAEIDRGLDEMRLPAFEEIRTLVTEVRASRRELAGMRLVLAEVVHAHTQLGAAITRAGEL